METKNCSALRLAPKLLAAISVVALAACQTAPHRESPRPTPAISTSVTPPPVPPPLPAPTEAKKVAVILGPGGAKAFAHVGVLRAFQQQRIPVSKIIGLEWGALIAGLYADKGQVNDVEWKLYKMEQHDLPTSKGYFTR